MHELYTKLGEEMVVLLPETTPYLYELLEGKCTHQLALAEFEETVGIIN